jgi:hypothetical protein
MTSRQHRIAAVFREEAGADGRYDEMFEVHGNCISGGGSVEDAVTFNGGVLESIPLGGREAARLVAVEGVDKNMSSLVVLSGSSELAMSALLGSGKNARILSPSTGREFVPSKAKEKDSFLGSIYDSICGRFETELGGGTIDSFEVYLSCFEVIHNNLVDLLAPGQKLNMQESSKVKGHALVSEIAFLPIHSSQDITRAIQHLNQLLGRRRHWESHLFCRFLVYRKCSTAAHKASLGISSHGCYIVGGTPHKPLPSPSHPALSLSFVVDICTIAAMTGAENHASRGLRTSQNMSSSLVALQVACEVALGLTSRTTSWRQHSLVALLHPHLLRENVEGCTSQVIVLALLDHQRVHLAQNAWTLYLSRLLEAVHSHSIGRKGSPKSKFQFNFNFKPHLAALPLREKAQAAKRSGQSQEAFKEREGTRQEKREGASEAELDKNNDNDKENNSGSEAQHSSPLGMTDAASYRERQLLQYIRIQQDMIESLERKTQSLAQAFQEKLEEIERVASSGRGRAIESKQGDAGEKETLRRQVEGLEARLAMLQEKVELWPKVLEAMDEFPTDSASLEQQIHYFQQIAAFQQRQILQLESLLLQQSLRACTHATDTERT